MEVNILLRARTLTYHVCVKNISFFTFTCSNSQFTMRSQKYITLGLISTLKKMTLSSLIAARPVLFFIILVSLLCNSIITSYSFLTDFCKFQLMERETRRKRKKKKLNSASVETACLVKLLR